MSALAPDWGRWKGKVVAYMPHFCQPWLSDFYRLISLLDLSPYALMSASKPEFFHMRLNTVIWTEVTLMGVAIPAIRWLYWWSSFFSKQGSLLYTTSPFRPRVGGMVVTSSHCYKPQVTLLSFVVPLHSTYTFINGLSSNYPILSVSSVFSWYPD